MANQRHKYNAPDGYTGVIERVQGSTFDVLLAPEPSGETGDKKPKFVKVGQLENQAGRQYSDIKADARRIAEKHLEATRAKT